MTILRELKKTVYRENRGKYRKREGDKTQIRCLKNATWNNTIDNLSQKKEKQKKERLKKEGRKIYLHYT